MTFQVITDPENPLHNLSYEEVLKEVKEDGYQLRHLQDDNQTEELCLAAVQQNEPDAIQYVADEFLHLFKDLK